MYCAGLGCAALGNTPQVTSTVLCCPTRAEYEYPYSLHSSVLCCTLYDCMCRICTVLYCAALCCNLPYVLLTHLCHHHLNLTDDHRPRGRWVSSENNLRRCSCGERVSHRLAVACTATESSPLLIGTCGGSHDPMNLARGSVWTRQDKSLGLFSLSHQRSTTSLYVHICRAPAHQAHPRLAASALPF